MAAIEMEIPKEAASVTRSYHDLSFERYLGLCAVFCAFRTAIQHPMNIALARKQTCARCAKLSSFEILREARRFEGGSWLRALSTGLPAFVCGTAASEVIYLGGYEYSRAHVPLTSEVQRDLVSGYTADFACRFLYSPMILVANRQMTATLPPAAISDADLRCYRAPDRAAYAFRGIVRNVATKEGTRGFFAGLGTTLAVGCSWSGVWWASYNQMKRAAYSAVPVAFPDPDASRLPRWVTSHDDNVLANSAASVLTSAATAVLFTPFLVVRTRLQVVPGSRLAGVVRTVYTEGGWRGFFKGAVLNVTACTLDGWLASSSYEWAKYLSDCKDV